MITVRLAGGLGNQLFQLAAAIEISERLNLPYAFFGSHLQNYATKRHQMLANVLREDFKINELGLFYRFILRYRINKIFPLVFPWYVSIQNIQTISAKKTLVLDDYFQDTNFIKTGISKVASMLMNIKNENGKLVQIYQGIKGGLDDRQLVAIHVRRGDYLKPENVQLYPVLNIDYYSAAIQKMDPYPNRIVVFSEDEVICKGKFSNAEIVHVKKFGLTDFEEFLLLSLFSNIVIANSTFSFWAAVITPAAVRFGPKTWSTRKWENDMWASNLAHYSIGNI